MTKLYEIINEEIIKHEKIIIHRHVRSDFDCIGAQSGLFYYIKENFPGKKVINATANDNHNFNILLSDVNIKSRDYEDSLVIVVDTANYERIDSLDIPKDCTLIKIDHHPDDTPYGDISLVEDFRSSTCEVLYYMFEYLNKTQGYKLNKNIAYSLICGIYGDTGGFSYSNTKSDTFKAMNNLMEFDINYESLVLELSTFDEDVIKLIGYAYQNVTIEDGLGYIVFDKQFQKEQRISPQKISLVANFLGKFNNLKTWIVFNEYSSFIRVNFRSKGNINVSKVASKFNGGGHKNASGASIYTWDDVELILKDLREDKYSK